MKSCVNWAGVDILKSIVASCELRVMSYEFDELLPALKKV